MKTNFNFSQNRVINNASGRGGSGGGVGNQPQYGTKKVKPDSARSTTSRGSSAGYGNYKVGEVRLRNGSGSKANDSKERHNSDGNSVSVLSGGVKRGSGGVTKTTDEMYNPRGSYANENERLIASEPVFPISSSNAYGKMGMNSHTFNPHKTNYVHANISSLQQTPRERTPGGGGCPQRPQHPASGPPTTSIRKQKLLQDNNNTNLGKSKSDGFQLPPAKSPRGNVLSAGNNSNGNSGGANNNPFSFYNRKDNEYLAFSESISNMNSGGGGTGLANTRRASRRPSINNPSYYENFSTTNNNNFGGSIRAKSHAINDEGEVGGDRPFALGGAGNRSIKHAQKGRAGASNNMGNALSFGTSMQNKKNAKNRARSGSGDVYAVYGKKMEDNKQNAHQPFSARDVPGSSDDFLNVDPYYHNNSSANYSDDTTTNNNNSGDGELVEPINIPPTKVKVQVVLSKGKTVNQPLQLTAGVGCTQGMRSTMEDEHFIHLFAKLQNSSSDDHDVGSSSGLGNGKGENGSADNSISMFAILDGHCGNRVPKLGKKILPKMLLRHPFSGNNTALAMVESVLLADKRIFELLIGRRKARSKNSAQKIRPHKGIDKKKIKERSKKLKNNNQGKMTQSMRNIEKGNFSSSFQKINHDMRFGNDMKDGKKKNNNKITEVSRPSTLNDDDDDDDYFEGTVTPDRNGYIHLNVDDHDEDDDNDGDEDSKHDWFFKPEKNQPFADNDDDDDDEYDDELQIFSKHPKAAKKLGEGKLATYQALENSGGSTLIFAALHGRMLTVACLGDARAVLCDGKPKQTTTRGNAGKGQSPPPPPPVETKAMSEDHKPTDAAERERITNKCKGTVQLGRVNGILAVSRALGDFEFKFSPQQYKRNVALMQADEPEGIWDGFDMKRDVMVSNVSDIKQIFLTDESYFLLLACDGLWDVLSNEEAAQFVKDFLFYTPEINAIVTGNSTEKLTEAQGKKILSTCCKKLAEYAVERGSTDNVSVLVVFFHDIVETVRALQALPPLDSAYTTPVSAPLPGRVAGPSSDKDRFVKDVLSGSFSTRSNATSNSNSKSPLLPPPRSSMGYGNAFQGAGVGGANTTNNNNTNNINGSYVAGPRSRPLW